MTKCPACQADLLEADLQAKQCSKCGAILDASLSSSDAPGPGDSTEDNIGATIDESAFPPADTEELAATDVDRTIPEIPGEGIQAEDAVGDTQSTIDDSVTGAFDNVADPGQTIPEIPTSAEDDKPTGSDTSEYSTVNDVAAVDPGQTIPDIPNAEEKSAPVGSGSVDQTMPEIPDEDLAALRGEESPTDPNQTIPDIPQEEEKSAPVGSGSVDQTMPEIADDDLAALRDENESSSSNKTVNDANLSDPMQTIDESALPVDEEEADKGTHATLPEIPAALQKEEDKSKKTVANVTGDQTVDLGSMDSAATFDSVSSVDGSSPGDGTVNERSIAATFDSTDVAMSAEAQVSCTWEGAVPDGVTVNTSLKANETQQTDTQSDLVIQPRNFRELAVEEESLEGTSVADYDLKTLLGEGGMGMVYAARQASIDRTVALKMLKPKTAKDEIQRCKFLAEAVVTGDLEHPNIVPIYDLGCNAEGALFYSMKRVQGTPWMDVIKEKSLFENIEILMKVADAVAFSHDRGIIHRDLKPENIMLGGFGEVLVMDWGLAVPVDKRRRIGGIQPSTSMGGTPAYMSPEMATGPFETIGTHSDIYLLGAMLFEIITGKPPHTGKDVMKCLFAAARNDIQPTTQKGELMDIARKAMATKPEDRYKKVLGFQEAIRDYLSHSESIALAGVAEEDLAAGLKSNDYQDFSRAMYGFQQAIELWEENEHAKECLDDTKLAYANAAKNKGDFDLGAGLLNTDLAEHVELLKEIVEAKEEVEARQHRLKTAKRLAIGLAATVFVVVTGALFWVIRAEAEAKKQRDLAVAAKHTAEEERHKAEIARNDAVEAKKEADVQREKAEENFRIAEVQREKAEENFRIAEVQRKKAVAATLAEAEQRKKAEKAETDARAAEKVAKMERDKAVVARNDAIEAQKKEAIQREKAEAATLAEATQRKKAEKAEADAREAEKVAKMERDKAVMAQKAEEVQRKKAVAAQVAEAEQRKKAEKAETDARAAEKVAKMERDKAVVARNDAIEAQKKEAIQREKAEAATLAEATQRKKAEKAEEDARAAEKVAKTERDKAVMAQKAEEIQRKKAEAAQLAEAEQRKKAVAAQKVAEAERQKAIEAKEAEEYEAYVARISAAVAKIEENNFDAARVLLEQCTPTPGERDYRNWEWGRLMHLCSQSIGDVPVRGAIDSIDFARDGNRFVTGGWHGKAQIWERSGRMLKEITTGGTEVHAVAFSPDGRYIATGTNDPDQPLKLWDANSGNLIRALDEQDGHTGAVVGVDFSADGSRLLTASYDNTAKIWNANTGEVLQTLHGHTWWVWDARFSPDDTQIVTVSQDGVAFVWTDATGKWVHQANIRRSPKFRGHDGPIYAAAFSPSGDSIATAGYDKRVLLWRPDQLQEFDFQEAIERFGQGDRTEVSEPQYQALEGHTAAVRDLRFSDAGQLLVSASHDNTIRVWNLEDPSAPKTLRGHGKAVRCCAISPDGEWLVSGGLDQHARVWNIDGYEEVRVLRGRVIEGHEDAVLAASFASDGKHVLTASRDSTARTWDFFTGKEVKHLKEGHEFLASHAVLFDEDRLLATAAVDGTVRIWDVAKGTQIQLLENTGRSATLAVSADGKWLVTGSNEDYAQIWDWQAGKVIRRLTDHDLPVSAVAISPNDQLIATADDNGRCNLWNAESGRLIHSMSGHTRKISAVAFTHDNNTLLTASFDKTVGYWSVQSGREERKLMLKHDAAVKSLATSPTKNQALTCDADGLVRLWDLSTAKPLQTFRSNLNDGTKMNFAAFTPDGEHGLTTNARAGVVRFWDLASGKEQAFQFDAERKAPFLFLGNTGRLSSVAISSDSNSVVTIGGNVAQLWQTDRQMTQRERRKMVFRPHGPVATARFSPDNTKIITASWDTTIKIWDAKTQNNLLTLSGIHHRAVNSVVFSPDGKLALSASDDGTAKLWNAADGKVQQVFGGHEAAVTSANFSADGKQVVTTSRDHIVRIWTVGKMGAARLLKSHDTDVLCAAFSNDGKWLASGSEKGVKIWELASATVVAELTSHTAAVTSVSFSPDSHRLLTGSGDFTAKVWDISKLTPESHLVKELITLKGHRQAVTSVSFSPNGRNALTSSLDGTAIIWLARPWDQAKLAKAK